MRGILEELRRRNVFRVAIAYAVVGWLLVQMAAILEPALLLPDWFTRVVTIFLVLGFPIALILSWAYELTPEGLKRSHEVDPGASIAPSTGRKLDRMIIAALLLGLGYFVWESRFSDAPDTGEGGMAAASIAVLPFVDLSPKGNQEYFSDGISEELLNLLAQVPELRVAARTSSFRFKGAARDIQDIARQLNVAHVVEGSVRRGGDSIRITAQLIDAGTGFHLWSATYDRELDDIFATQDEISAAIVAALSETLGLALPSAPRVQRTANSAAYDEYLLGLLEMNRRSGASLEVAKEHLERALALDPGYAPAHARLAITLGLLPEYNNRYTIKDIKETWAYHVERAMVLAPDAPESLAAKGLYGRYNARPLREVRAILDRAVELNPSDTDVLNWLAQVSRSLGDYQAWNDIFARALRIDPLNRLTIANNALRLNRVGRFDEAGVLVDRLRAISPAIYWLVLAELAEARGLTANAAIYRLEQLAIDSTSMRGRNNFANLLAFGLGLADETSGLDHRNWRVLVMNGQIEEALRWAEDFVAGGNTGPKGQVLLSAGRPGEAAGYLNQAWDQALAIATLDRLGSARLFDIGRARQMTGDPAGGEEALEAALAVIARFRAVEVSLAELDWSEGAARYFLGRKEAGIGLVARSVERGFVWYPLQPQYQPLTDDPAFAPILGAREAYAAAERDKFLRVVCNGGNPAPQVWTPKPETCEGYIEG